MDSKITEDLIICHICSKTFDEKERLPRVLSCGHSFCHSCLENLYARKICCPNCNKDIKLEIPELIPVNISLKRLLSSINDQSGVTKPGKKRKLHSVGFCDEHDNYQEMRCVNCEIWICGMCATLHHKTCQTLLIKDAYKELNKGFFEKLENQKEIRKMVEERINESLVSLQIEETALTEELKKLEEVATCTKERIKELTSIKSDEKELCEKLSHLQTLAEIYDQEKDLTSEITELDALKDQGNLQLGRLENFQIYLPLNIKSLEKMCETESVYAVEHSDKDLFGQIRVKDKRILISSFNVENPNTARLIPFRKLLTKFLGTAELPSSVFLQIGQANKANEEIEDIYVVIKTYEPTSPRGKSLILLCSELKKPPSRLHNYIGGTLQERNTTTVNIAGPPPILSGTTTNGTMHLMQEGHVYGMDTRSASFTIKVGETLNDYKFYIGNVVSGLQSLKDGIAKFTLTIKETGLVI